MTKTKNLILFGILLLMLVSVIFFLIPYLVTQKSWYWSYNETTGTIGDTIGGIAGPVVGFIGIILTFLAFYIQYQANQYQIIALEEQKISAKNQERQILIQQFENNFFELLKLHRDNVKEFSYRNSEGRNVIIQIINEFFEILMVVQESGIIRKNRLDEQDLANISYLILFFGVDETVTDVLENRFHEKYATIYDDILKIIEGLRKKAHPTIEKYYYNGHQSRLGHYFRHMLRTILYVHNNKFLTADQKKEYVAIVRAQLSNHEQILLFFDSISDLGLAWELENKKDKLITTYNLIRNIPLGSIYGYRPKRYYPKLELEHNFEIRL